VKLFIVTDEPVPYGMAATNRMLSLSRGLVEEGIPVQVICIRTTEKREENIINKNSTGTIQGIQYEYSCGTTLRGETFFKRRYLSMRGIWYSVFLLRKAQSKDILMLYLSSPSQVIFYYLAAKLFGLYYIIDKSEYPFVLNNKSAIGKLYAYLYTSYIYKLFDAILVMTTPLQSYFAKRIRKNAKLLLVPMTVESARFLNNQTISPERDRYIAYCGYLGGNKDGVSILINSFALLLKKINNIKLYIIGDAQDTNDLENLQVLAKELNIEKYVVFTGHVSREDMPGYLCHAAVLALARPTSLQSQGGFPTKLGEYLSTGNPVVVTSVGDIPFFLKDGDNAFLSVPDSAEAFAQKLEYVLTNPEHAKQVGIKGRETALTNFDYKVQAKRLVDFLSTIS